MRLPPGMRDAVEIEQSQLSDEVSAAESPRRRPNRATVLGAPTSVTEEDSEPEEGPAEEDVSGTVVGMGMPGEVAALLAQRDRGDVEDDASSPRGQRDVPSTVFGMAMPAEVAEALRGGAADSPNRSEAADADSRARETPATVFGMAMPAQVAEALAAEESSGANADSEERQATVFGMRMPTDVHAAIVEAKAAASADGPSAGADGDDQRVSRASVDAERDTASTVFGMMMPAELTSGEGDSETASGDERHPPEAPDAGPFGVQVAFEPPSEVLEDEATHQRDEPAERLDDDGRDDEPVEAATLYGMRPPTDVQQAVTAAKAARNAMLAAQEGGVPPALDRDAMGATFAGHPAIDDEQPAEPGDTHTDEVDAMGSTFAGAPAISSAEEDRELGAAGDADEADDEGDATTIAPPSFELADDADASVDVEAAQEAGEDDEANPGEDGDQPIGTVINSVVPDEVLAAAKAAALAVSSKGGSTLDIARPKVATGGFSVPSPRDLTNPTSISLSKKAEPKEEDTVKTAFGLRPTSQVRDALAKAAARHKSNALQAVEAELGDLEQVPRRTVELGELVKLNLDGRSGLLLSLIDGSMTYADILDISGMPRDEALRLLLQLRAADLIRVD